MLTWGSPLRSPAAAGRPSQEAAQPTWPPLLCRLPPRQGNGVCPTLAGTRARHLPPLLATSCFPGLPRCPGRSHAAAPHRSHSPSPSSSSPALSPSHPRTTAAADGHHRSHRLSLASPSSPGAPPRRQLPPRRATQAGVPRGAVAVAKFDSGRRGPSPAIRELPGIPDLALALASSAVSPRTEPPPPRVRLPRLASSPPRP